MWKYLRLITLSASLLFVLVSATQAQTQDVIEGHHRSIRPRDVFAPAFVVLLLCFALRDTPNRSQTHKNP